MDATISKILHRIERDLAETLDVDSLAKMAGYSPYHFSRMFKVSVGESVMSYVSRLRLERASSDVIVSVDRSIIEIALDAGFSTPNGFNKAFKKIFHMTPTEYRSRRKVLLRSYKDSLMEIPRIVERERVYVVYTRERGEYENASEKAWKRLSEQLNKWAKGFKDTSVDISLDPKDAEIIGICHDDPNITAEERIRYDAAISWGKDEVDLLKREGFDTKEIVGGDYAMVTYKGPYAEILDSWMGLYAWCEEHGLKLRDQPAFERYLNSPEDVRKEELLTEIYIPIDRSSVPG